jgi:hypothetical protein
MNDLVLLTIHFYLVDGGLMMIIVQMSLSTENTIRHTIPALYGIGQVLIIYFPTVRK